ERVRAALGLPGNHGVSYRRLTLKHKQPRRRLSLLKVIGLEALGQSRRLIRLRGIARRARRASAAAGAGVRALPWLVGMVLADPAHILAAKTPHPIILTKTPPQGRRR